MQTEMRTETNNERWAATAGAPPHPRVRQLVAYWRQICPGTGLLPGRQHFDPLQVPVLLPNIWLADVISGVPREFRYRLIGSRIIDAGIPGRKGDRVDDPRHLADPAVARRLLEAIADGHEPNWWRGAPLLRHSTYVKQIERVSLPLAADGRTCDIILNLTLFTWDDGSVR